MIESIINNFIASDDEVETKVITGIKHSFIIETIITPIFCDYCEEMIVVGLSKDAYRCSVCNIFAHRCCVELIPKSCTRNIDHLTTLKKKKLKNKRKENSKSFVFPHFWKENSYTIPTQCNICEYTLIFSDGLECSRCNKIVHKECQSNAPHCKPLHKNLIYIKEIDHIKSNTQSQRRTPLLIIINPSSGGKYGTLLFDSFRSLLCDDQVFLLDSNGPKPIIQKFHDVVNLRILVCGGDGTVGWVMNCVDEIKFAHGKPLICVLPLGTGNDLSRSLGWGKGYHDENLSSILYDIEYSKPVLFDRWKVEIEQQKPSKQDDHTNQLLSSHTIMNNYLSIGVDAKVALEFHELRSSNPEIFRNRSLNKLFYATLGTKTFFESRTPIDQYLQLKVDGKDIEIPDDIQGLLFLNIDHYAGGARAWGEYEENQKGLIEDYILTKPSIQDKKLEIGVILNSVHMGMVSIELDTVMKLCQGNEIVLDIKSLPEGGIPFQIDGEPSVIKDNCRIQISFYGQCKILQKV